MSSESKKTRLDKVLEYAIFSNITLTLFDEAKPDERFRIELQDIDDGIFKAHPQLQVCFEKLSKSERIYCLLNYKNQALSFETRIMDRAADGLLTLNLPAFGYMGNQRQYPRMVLHDSTGIDVTMEVRTQTGPIVFKEISIKDVSQKGIALNVKRKEGLVLPGEVATALHVNRGTESLYSGSGRILRVQREKNDTGYAKDYVAVFEFPSAVLKEQDKNKRRLDRVCLLDRAGSFISFSHPLFPLITLTGQLADISTSGMSFLIDKTRYPVFKGLKVKGADVQLPFVATEKCSFRISHVQEVADGDSFHYRVGVHFTQVTPRLHKAIAEIIQSRTSPNLIDANSAHYEDLWELFFESGFIYREKRRHLQQFAANVFKTYLKLLNTRTPIMKKILFKEGEELRGHISAIKTFDSAWLVQHLNASGSNKDASPAQSVLSSMTKFFLDDHANKMTNASFICFFYRPSNTYPSILFGHARDYINDRSVCDYMDLDYCLPRSKLDVVSLDESIKVEEASENDLETLESILVEQQLYTLIRVENLTVEGLSELKVQAEFEKLGLYRTRRVFSARIGENKAYAVCNYASPGINLSELTNSFRIYFSNPNAIENQQLANCLAVRVIQTYKNSEMPYGTYLSNLGGVIPAQFEKVKIYRYWFMENRAMPLYQEAANEVFSNFRKFLERFKREQMEGNSASTRSSAL